MPKNNISQRPRAIAARAADRTNKLRINKPQREPAVVFMEYIIFKQSTTADIRHDNHSGLPLHYT